MQLWRAGNYSLASLLPTLVSLSITRFWFISKNRFLRIPELNAISSTTPIIQNRRESWSGLRKRALFRIKRTGILSEASCAYTRFTASGCSSSSFRAESRNLLIVFFGVLTKIAERDWSTLFDITRDRSNARSTVTAQTSSANTRAGSRTIAAQSSAHSAGGKVTILVCRKQKPQCRFDARCPGRFAVGGAFDFEITKVDTELPAFVDQIIA